MNTQVLRVIGVGMSDALRYARKDVRLDLRRCEDALDALALACAEDGAPDAMVFDAHAASLEDMRQVRDAALHAGLPEPVVLAPGADNNALWRAIDPSQANPTEPLGFSDPAAADQPEKEPQVDFADPETEDEATVQDESLEALEGLVHAIEAILEGEPALETLLDRCASFGVRLEDLDTPIDERHAHATIDDDEGDPLAMLVAPRSLAPLLPTLARACAGLYHLEDAVTTLIDEASMDAHTGLPDRCSLLEELELRIDEARPARESFTLALVRLDSALWDDEDAPHDLAESAPYGAVTAWGVIGLVFDDEQAEPDLDGAPIDACATVVYPWDGADAETLVEAAETLLRALVRTDTV